MRISLPESLSNATVSLRPFREDDAPAFAQAFRDDPTLGDAIGVESGEFLGLIAVFAFDRRHGRCEVGFWLVPQARGRGVARRALTIALDWVFGDLGQRRAELTTTPDSGR